MTWTPRRDVTTVVVVAVLMTVAMAVFGMEVKAANAPVGPAGSDTTAAPKATPAFSMSRSGPSPERVVVVANSRDPDSEAIARYYIRKRNIPETNLILMDAPDVTDVTWPEFVDKIFNPLRERLTKDGWLQAYPTDLKDADGRLRYGFFGNRIDFLVVCYGMPIRILNDPARLTATPLTLDHKELYTNQAAVDSELALLAASNTPTTGLVNNPLFGKMNPDDFTRELVVKVARLDGPSPEAVRGLIDSALVGEAHGLQGRAYIDMGGPHQEGEDWLKAASATVRRLGFDVTEDHNKELIGWGTRFDAPAIYLGWYAGQPSGPISDAQFRFPPGAIAVHIHSFSGDAIRKADARWVGPLVVRGVAATVGNVFEPYLSFTHHLDLLMDGLAHGMTTGEAAYYSLPALSWMEVFIGDPLYRPFAVSVPEQLDQAARTPTVESPYAVIREMHLLEDQSHPADALALGEKSFAQKPDLALALALAQNEHGQDHDADALKQLAWCATVDPVPRGDLGLLGEIARWAAAHGGKALALELYAKVLSAPGANPDLLNAFLPEALNLARTSGDEGHRGPWQKQYDLLNPAPKAGEKP